MPVLVAYDVPGRDRAQYSAGGALSQADYEAWIDGFAQGIGSGKAIVQNMGSAVAATHFVIDTSRNGDGPNNMQAYANAPYDQPASVIATLADGNWCNPPPSRIPRRVVVF